jgi:hypothetical protein
LVSPTIRFEAADSNAIVPPSAEMTGLVLASFPPMEELELTPEINVTRPAFTPVSSLR